MLTTGQQKYLNSLSDDRVANILPFDKKCLETGKEIEIKLQEILTNTKIYYIGSSVLEIAGENDIDISVVSNSENFISDLEIMKSNFGEPKELKLEKEYVKWEFVKNSFQVELYLNGKMSPILEEQIKTHNILLNDLNLKYEYENLKLQFNNKSWKEYMAAKMEFFNRVLTSQKPIVYLLCGLPGSGKTHFAKTLENESTIRFTLDEEFFKKYGENFDKSKYSELEQELISEIIQKAENLVKGNKSIILDFGFWKKRGRQQERLRFEKLGAEVKLFYFKLEKETRYARVESRDKDKQHDLNLEALEKFENEFEEPDEEDFVYINN